MILTHCWQRPGWPALPPHFETEGKLPWAHAKVAGNPSGSRASTIFRRRLHAI